MKLHLFVFCLTSVALSSDLALANGVLECTEDEHCIADEATCVGELCECPLGKVFSMDGTQCLELAVGYEAPCEDDVQCAWLLGKHVCNLANKCVCAEGWRFYGGKCTRTRRLLQSCTQNEDCFVSNDIYSMVCSNGFCTCNDGYYARGSYDCRPIGTKPGDFCALDMDCKFEDSYCDRSWCEFKTRRYNISESNVVDDDELSQPKNLYDIGSPCSTSEDCHEAHSFCSALTKTCICTRGYFLHTSGECIAELGTNVSCVSDSDCQITPRRCVNGSCACPLTHYVGGGLNKCVKVAFSPEFACVTDEWCGIFGSGAICVGDDEAYCRCSSSTTLDENFICRSGGGGGGGCVVNDDCYALQNSVCQQGVCVCPPNYRIEGNACLPNIGGECNVNVPCLIEHTDCLEEVCTCKERYIAEGELLCVEVAGGLGSPCNSNPQCLAVIEDSVCSDGICNCKAGYRPENDECLEVKLMGDYCVLPTQCHVLLGNNVQCRNSICQCSADMEVTPDGLDCRYPNAAPSGCHASSSFLIALVLLCIAGY